MSSVSLLNSSMWNSSFSWDLFFGWHSSAIFLQNGTLRIVPLHNQRHTEQNVHFGGPSTTCCSNWRISSSARISVIETALKSNFGNTRVLCSVEPTVILRHSYPANRSKVGFADKFGNKYSSTEIYHLDCMPKFDAWWTYTRSYYTDTRTVLRNVGQVPFLKVTNTFQCEKINEPSTPGKRATMSCECRRLRS